MNQKNAFTILGDQSTPINQGETIKESAKASDLNERIGQLIASAPVFLFMKGTAQNPQCGFSANVVSILNHLRVPFKSFDILTDMDIREGVKAWADWPTYPQLYVKGELIGGNDIVASLFESGELEQTLKEAHQ